MVRTVTMSAILVMAIVILPVSSVFAAGAQDIETEREEVTITFSFGLDPGGAIRALAERYSEITPGVTVEPLELPSTPNEQYDRYVTTFAAQDDSIDVLLTDIIWVPQFAAAGWIKNVDNDISEASVNTLLRGPVNANRYRGELHGLPLFTDTGLLYYRTDLLEKYGFNPPETWEELVAQSRTILDGERDPNLTGIVFQAAQIEGITINFLEFFKGTGGSVLDSRGDYVLPEYAPEARAALQFMYDMIYEYEVAPVSVTTANPNDNRITFQEGNAIFMRNWPFAWGSLQDTEQSEVAGNVGIAPIPYFEGNGGATTSNLGGWQIAVSSYTDNPDAALGFLQWAVSEEAQMILAEQGSQLPVLASLYQDEAFRSLNPLYEDILSILERTFPRPVTEYYTEISAKMQPELNGALTRVKPVEQAINDLIRSVTEIFEQ